jgi:hypothetical protein
MKSKEFVEALINAYFEKTGNDLTDEDVSLFEYYLHDGVIPRRLAARVVHLFMTRILNIPDIDWDEALKLRDIYECRSCANAIAQVYQRGIMLPIDEDRFGLSEDVTPEALERIIDRLYCVEL